MNIALIIKKFEEFNALSNELIDITQNIYENLKEKNINKVDYLKRQQILITMDMEEARKKLINEIIKNCDELNMEKKTITSLLEYMTIEEKEQIMACQETAIRFDYKLENNLITIKRQLEYLMAPTETVVDILNYYATQENGRKSFSIDKKL